MLKTIAFKFDQVIQKGKGYQGLCPAHDDKEQSLSINPGDNGGVVLYCHAGCSIENILQVKGLTKRDLFVNANAEPGNGFKTYDYTDETGKLLYQTVRWKGKKFYQRRPNGEAWINNLNGTRRVIYRLPELLKAQKEFPVFIVEGEKDVETLRSIGQTATCNPQGAGKWADEYSDYLKGFQCVILPDNDGPGEKHAVAVAESLVKRGIDTRILHLPALPEKGDVSDWIDQGNTSEDLYALLTGADNYSPGLLPDDPVSAKTTVAAAGDGRRRSTPVTTGENAGAISDKEKKDEADSELPKNYFLNESGVHYRGEKSTFFVCSPLSVAAKTCDADNESWGRRLQFKDAQNVKHDLVIPMALLSSDGAELRARLMDCGLIIGAGSEARQKFLGYILSAEPKKHMRCVNQLGWHDGAFVLPDEVISANGDGDSLLLQNVDRTANKFKTSGTLSEWQDSIARYCVGNSRLMFAVGASFAAALLPIAEETGGGFHIHGTSSTGKTTALYVAGSVWGGRSNKGFLDTWKSTGNGLEAVAELHNHSLLLLDEINEVDPSAVGEIVYALSNGFGKSRMNKNITARRKTEWSLMFFSTGEETLEQKMQSVGQRTRGGQEARFVNIEADANKGLGIFEDLHEFESANDMAKHLSSISRKFYGTAIREFLRAVCANTGTVETRIKDCRQMFQARLKAQDASGEVYRVASRFALVAAGAILASEFGVTKWQKQDVITCVERIFSEWLDERGTTGSYDTERAVRRVLSFIRQHGSSRFESYDRRKDFSGNDIDERISNRAGFKRPCSNGSTEYLILSEVFEREICEGQPATSIAKELEKRGLLRRGKEKTSLQDRVSLPGLSKRERVYVIVPDEVTAAPA